MSVIRTSGGDRPGRTRAVTGHRGADRLRQTTSLDAAAIARAIDGLAAGRAVLLTETEELAQPGNIGRDGCRLGSAAHQGSWRGAHAAPHSAIISTMGFLDRLLGRRTGRESLPRQDASASSRAAPGELTDEQALERYRYLVRTAPPEAIERAHEEAFAALTPEQRRMALRDLSAVVPEHERAGDEDPRSLARMATRAELNRPGSVERAFGGGGGMLGGMGGTLLGSFAAAFAGSLVAQSLFSELGGDEGAEGDGGAEGDAGDAGGDTGGGDAGGGDIGGGELGGGDVGGGDFGGGDISF